MSWPCNEPSALRMTCGPASVQIACYGGYPYAPLQLMTATAGKFEQTNPPPYFTVVSPRCPYYPSSSGSDECVVNPAIREYVAPNGR